MCEIAEVSIFDKIDKKNIYNWWNISRGLFTMLVCNAAFVDSCFERALTS